MSIFHSKYRFRVHLINMYSTLLKRLKIVYYLSFVMKLRCVKLAALSSSARCVNEKVI